MGTPSDATPAVTRTSVYLKPLYHHTVTRSRHAPGSARAPLGSAPPSTAASGLRGRPPGGLRRLAVLALLPALAAAAGAGAPAGAAAAQPAPPNRVVELLRAGQVAFGTIVGDRREAAGAALAADPRLDFVFYDMERSWDLEAFEAFRRAFRAGGSGALLVRIPPVADGPEAAAERVAELLAAGVDGVVFPHVRGRDDAELAVELLRAGGRGVWPLDPEGQVVGYFMIESPEGLANARGILSTPGVGLGAPGQGSLRSALGDPAAVEEAIGTVLDACLALGVVCAKLVDEGDVERRIREGFRVILASGAALDAGRRLAGRAPGPER